MQGFDETPPVVSEEMLNGEKLRYGTNLGRTQLDHYGNIPGKFKNIRQVV